MFDIREDLPAELEAPAPPAAPKKVEVPKPKPRYLIKKGVKQVVRALPFLSSLRSSSPDESLIASHRSSSLAYCIFRQARLVDRHLFDSLYFRRLSHSPSSRAHLDYAGPSLSARGRFVARRA